MRYQLRYIRMLTSDGTARVAKRKPRSGTGADFSRGARYKD